MVGLKKCAKLAQGGEGYNFIPIK